MSILRYGKVKIKKQAVSAIFSLSMALSAFSGISFTQEVSAAEQVVLHNPVVDMADSSQQKYITIHFKNTCNWDNVGIWIWEGIGWTKNVTPKDKCPAYHTSTDPKIESHPIWPGAKMSAEEDYDGWYSIMVPFEDTSKGAIMIFNNLVADTKVDTLAGGDLEDQAFLEASGLIMDTSRKKQSPNQAIIIGDFTATEYWCDFDGDCSGEMGKLTSVKPESYVHLKDKPAEDNESPAAVTYSNETVSVKDGGEGYSFFTASKVSRTVSKNGTVKTTIPAANKWEVTNGGQVDVSAYPGGKTLYFAKSTTPAYDEIITVIVPAQPKFTSIGYNPSGKSGSTVELLKMPKMKIKKKTGGTDTITLQEGDEARIQYRRKDTEDFRNGTDFPGELPAIQKSGATMEIRTTSAGETEAEKNDKGVYCFSDAEVLPSLKAAADTYEAGTFLRPGIIKTVKITKRAAAPAVAVDFANHSFRLKKGQEYAELTGGIKPFLDKDSIYKTAAKDEVIYFKDNQVYMVRTVAKAGKSPKAASLPVFITTGTTKTFADAYGTGNKVTVKGGASDKNHVMTISRTVKEGKDAKETKSLNPAQSYQYAIVDKASDYINPDGTLNYKKLDDDKKTVKWTAATIKAGSGSVSVTLKESSKVKIIGKQVILRAAKGTNVLSSKAVILTAPTGQTDNWTQEAAGSGKAETCLNISSTADYDAATRTFKIKASGVKEAAGEKTVTIKVSQGSGKSKKSEDIPGTVTVTDGNAVISACIKDKGFSESDSLKLSITVPANTLAGMDGSGNAEQTFSKTVDTKAPVISECELLEDNKLRLTIDAPVQFGDGNNKITLAVTGDVAGCAKFVKIYAVGAGKDTLVTNADVKGTYTKGAKKRTFDIEYTMSESVADYKVVIEGLTDAAGNPIKLKSGFTSKTVTATEETGSIAFRFKTLIYEQRVAPSAAPAA